MSPISRDSSMHQKPYVEAARHCCVATAPQPAQPSHRTKIAHMHTMPCCHGQTTKLYASVAPLAHVQSWHVHVHDARKEKVVGGKICSSERALPSGTSIVGVHWPQSLRYVHATFGEHRCLHLSAHQHSARHCSGTSATFASNKDCAHAYDAMLSWTDNKAICLRSTTGARAILARACTWCAKRESCGWESLLLWTGLAFRHHNCRSTLATVAALCALYIRRAPLPTPIHINTNLHSKPTTYDLLTPSLALLRSLCLLFCFPCAFSFLCFGPLFVSYFRFFPFFSCSFLLFHNPCFSPSLLIAVFHSFFALFLSSVFLTCFLPSSLRK